MDFDLGTILYLIVLIGGLLATAVQRERSQRKVEERRRNAPPPRPRPPSPFDEPALDRRFEAQVESAAPPTISGRSTQQPKRQTAASHRPGPPQNRGRSRTEDIAQHLLRHSNARNRSEAEREARFLLTRFPPSAPALAGHSVRSKKRRHHTGALRHALRTKNRIRDLILLSEILGPPVSQRDGIAPGEKK
ncbi:MAG: hypothetical protein RL885_00530 [Planctomycetota bacterium]